MQLDVKWRNDKWDSLWNKGIRSDVHPLLIDLVKKYSPGKKILEVGFGTGGDLTVLSKLGFECWGLEKSKVSYNLGRKNGKFRAVFGDGENAPFKNGKFNLIFHQGLLEHFRNPHKFMTEQWRMLKNKGVVVIDVPHKWNAFTIYKKIYQLFGKWYGGWERSYSAFELKNLIEGNGFETLGIFYRGIFPHQWGKFLFPEKIIKNKVTKDILTKSPIKYVQKSIRFIYNKSRLLQTISSYNVIIVARKT